MLARAHRLLGAALMRRGGDSSSGPDKHNNIAEATASLHEAVRLQPDDSEAQSLLATALAALQHCAAGAQSGDSEANPCGALETKSA